MWDALPRVLHPALIAVHHRLRAAPDVPALLELAGAQARDATGYPTALVAPLEDDLLVLPGTAPATLDEVAHRLGLTQRVSAPIVPDDRPLAVLLVGRPSGPPAPGDQDVVTDLALVIAVAVRRLVLRRRAEELATEVRRFADLARSLTADVVDAPIALPTDHGLGAALPTSTAIVSSDPRYLALSAREKRIAGLLVEGRSNREIADVLILSPETVKTHVTRILRKLGVGGRVEAVALLLGRT